MKNLTLLTIAGLCAYITMSSCSKKSDDVTYDFTYTGNAVAGNTLTFTSNAPSDKEVKWVFGVFTDDTLYGKVVDYTFNSNGKHSVKMIIDNNTTKIVEKTIDIALPDISAIFKKRHWVGERNIHKAPGVQQIDTFLTPVLVDGSVVRFFEEEAAFKMVLNKNLGYRFESLPSLKSFSNNNKIYFTYYIAQDSCDFSKTLYQGRGVLNWVRLNTVK